MFMDEPAAEGENPSGKSPPGVVVHVEPLGINLHVRDGETVFEAAWRQGYAWPTRCNGQAQCTFCVLELEGDDGNALPPEREEQLVIDRVKQMLGSDLGMRLACRLKVIGPVVVQKEGVSRIVNEL
jgi:2Fe-2S ferredoxin